MPSLPSRFSRVNRTEKLGAVAVPNSRRKGQNFVICRTPDF